MRNVAAKQAWIPLWLNLSTLKCYGQCWNNIVRLQQHPDEAASHLPGIMP